MEIRIENGKTIISTNGQYGVLKNKHNYPGLSISERGGYRTEIQVNKKKYYLGTRSTVEEAISLRKEAERYVEEGTFFEWLECSKKKSVRNKNGYKGIFKTKNAKGSPIYKAKIVIKNKAYQIGTRRTLEEAVAIREEAERQLANGTFYEWLLELRNAK